MSENQLQFRVGVFVILSLGGLVVLIFQFGKLESLLEPRYTVMVHFNEATGVYPSTLVKQHGLSIGEVGQVSFDREQGGVLVELLIKGEYRLQKDCRAELEYSLLGDATINIIPGKSSKVLAVGARIEGEEAESPLDAVYRLEEQVALSLQSFEATSAEWRMVGQQINTLLSSNEQNVEAVMQQSIESLQQFGETMKLASETLKTANAGLEQANLIIGNPKHQKNLQATLESLPTLVKETQETILAARGAIQKIDENLANLNDVTTPLAEKSQSMITHLETTLTNLEATSEDISQFTELLTTKDGTLQRMASDPTLYENLNTSASSLSLLLTNLEPIIKDLNIFSDKIARHPEVLGVRGAMNPSSGIKDVPSQLPTLPAPQQIRGNNALPLRPLNP